MATTTHQEPARTTSPQDGNDLQERALRHMWMHFTRMGSYRDQGTPILVRGEGCHVDGRRGTD